jgi:hypothetical protein
LKGGGKGEEEGEGSGAGGGECGSVSENALVAVIVLIFALCRHLVAQRSAAVKFAKAVRATIEPLTSDVVEGGSCTAGQPSISPPKPFFARERERHGGDHVWLGPC